MLQISLSSSEGRHCIVFSLVLRPQHQAQELVFGPEILRQFGEHARTRYMWIANLLNWFTLINIVLYILLYVGITKMINYYVCLQKAHLLLVILLFCYKVKFA